MTFKKLIRHGDIFKTLEIIPFPDGLTKEGEKILAEQKEKSRRILAEQMVLETNLAERKSAFAKKKAELHQKFLQKKAKGR